MASINATTSSGIVATADNTGQLQLQSAGTTVMTITSTGVTTQVGAPAFSASVNATQSFSSATWTRITSLGTVTFNVGSCFSSNRFTPNMAGYYQFNMSMVPNYTGTGGSIPVGLGIYKNGSAAYYPALIFASSSGSSQTFGSCIIYCNGTTDYIDFYVLSAGTSPNLTANGEQNFVQGFLVRSA
jgi:hypothetical protein